MAQQHGYRSMGEDMPRHSTEHPLAETRVPVGPHDDQVCADLARGTKKDGAGLIRIALELSTFDRHAVVHQVSGKIERRQPCRHPDRWSLLAVQDDDPSCFLQQR